MESGKRVAVPHMKPVKRFFRGERLTLEIPVFAAAKSHERFLVHSSYCIQGVSVNGVPVAPDRWTPCTSGKWSGVSPVWEKGNPLDLQGYLLAGENTVQLRFGQATVNEMIELLPDPHALLWLKTLRIVLLLSCVAALLLCAGMRKDMFPLAGILAVGVFLRLFYTAVTPYFMRTYDLHGHMEYISYLREHWRMPVSGAGWEFHQPPLYYALSALWLEAGQWMGRNILPLVRDLQNAALLLSIGTFAAGLWIGRRLFRPEERAASLLYAGFLATLPGLIFLGSRISNDPLAHFLAFLAFGLLLAFWQEGGKQRWYGLCALLGAALLTKLTALPLVAAAAACLLFSPRCTPREKCRMALAGACIVIAIFGGVALVRMFEEKGLFGNPMNPVLSVENSPKHLLSFSPANAISLPFNNNWSDTLRRQYFWEYLLKSSFFGEWNFIQRIGFLGSYIMLVAVLLLPYGLTGCYTEYWKKRAATLPLWLTGLLLLGILLSYRLLRAYSPNQDFRFIALIAIPAAYAVARGIESSTGILRTCGRGFAVGLMGLCALFIVLLGI